MHQEAPNVISEGQNPFDHEGNFKTEIALDLALEQRALGDLDAAAALDLLIDFFMTSQNYIFNGGSSLNYEFSSAGKDTTSSASTARWKFFI